jgi:hypothetical protein
VVDQARRVLIAEQLLAWWPAAIMDPPEAPPPSPSVAGPSAPPRAVAQDFGASAGSPLGEAAVRGAGTDGSRPPPAVDETPGAHSNAGLGADIRADPPANPASSPPSAPADDAPGTLAVEFEHHLRRGNLQVWVDGARVIDEDFEGPVTRKILSLELRKGVVQQVLPVSPGRHEVLVEVRWDDNVKSARISGEFRPGATRRLEVKVGRMRGNLGLAWN